MAKHALIDSVTNKVVNALEWDGVAQWSPPSGHFIVPLTGNAGPGWSWDGVNFIEPPSPPPVPIDPIDELRKALEADPLLLDKIKALK